MKKYYIRADLCLLLGWTRSKEAHNPAGFLSYQGDNFSSWSPRYVGESRTEGADGLGASQTCGYLSLRGRQPLHFSNIHLNFYTGSCALLDMGKLLKILISNYIKT